MTNLFLVSQIPFSNLTVPLDSNREIEIISPQGTPQTSRDSSFQACNEVSQP